MENQPNAEWFEHVISKLEDVDDVLLMEGHQKSHKKVSDALELLNWAEENLTRGTLPCGSACISIRRPSS